MFRLWGIRVVKQLAPEHRREGDDEQIVRSLCSVLWGSPEEEARLAANSLGDIGSPKAVKALCQSLTMVDKDGNLRACVCNALVSIGPSAVEDLCLMLNYKDCTVRTCAAYALGMIGDTKAIEPLRKRFQAINNPKESISDTVCAELAGNGKLTHSAAHS
jgi:HEAT repeat protein